MWKTTLHCLHKSIWFLNLNKLLLQDSYWEQICFSHTVSIKSHWVTKCWIFFLQNSIAGTACWTWGFYWKDKVPTSKYSSYKYFQRCGREDFLFKMKLHILTCWHMMGLWIHFYQELYMWLLHFILLVTSCFLSLATR